MRSRHLVDPDLEPGLDVMPTVQFSEAILPTMRQQMAQMVADIPAPPALDADVTEHRITTAEGHDISLLIHRSRSSSGVLPAVLYMHGGGYVIGSAEMTIVPNRQMALEADCVVVSVDYRLAPETPHPGPVEDCYAALKWLHGNAASLGVDRARIAVAGDSAGGGMAAALALLARDRGEIQLVHQHLIYPMIDDRTCAADPHPYAGEFVWTPESNHFGWSSLLGCAPGSQNVSPYAAAARAEDLSGLPSTFISVGALDLFAEEDMDYARRLIRAGVPTELHVYPGAYHGFGLAPDAPVTKSAHQASINALRRALHRAQPPR